jgi:crotonobetainyl-CoA:carnitine CoA-transferase CaiB-like acyl-CoA transferase
MGPLEGIKIVEFAGLGPAPMCAMLLAEMGANVIRIERKLKAENAANPRPLRYDLLLRGRRAVPLDLKHEGAIACVMDMVAQAHALIEGFRPGVMERLGLGPQPCLARNPALVYGRMTAWGQDGPLAQSPARDLNAVALSGALHAIGRRGQAPAIPLSLVGDFGGGALYLSQGILAGIISAQRTGRGQVIDAAMVDGAASLMTNFYGRWASGSWRAERGTNITDSGAYFYDVYECADGGWLAVAALDAASHAELLDVLGLEAGPVGPQSDRASWDKSRSLLAARFRTRPRDAWCAAFEGREACVAPVLDFHEAPRHPHLQSRRTFVDIAGIPQPAPAPRFSDTPTRIPMPPQELNPANSDAALAEWFSEERIAMLRQRGVID